MQNSAIVTDSIAYLTVASQPKTDNAELVRPDVKWLRCGRPRHTKNFAPFTAKRFIGNLPPSSIKHYIVVLPDSIPGCYL